jgi:hypothetical protein
MIKSIKLQKGLLSCLVVFICFSVSSNLVILNAYADTIANGEENDNNIDGVIDPFVNDEMEENIIIQKDNVVLPESKNTLIVELDSKATVGIYSNVINGIEYSVNASTLEATVIGYTSSTKDLVIPSSITVNNIEYTVTAIGPNAFYSASVTHSLTSVVIPDSVITIGAQAFRQNDLVSVKLGNSVKIIDNNAFRNNRITTLEIPDSVTDIGVDAFRLNAIEDITLGGSVTTIGTRAFMNNLIKDLTIPDSVITINESAFEANQLMSLEIGQSVITIGDKAFFNNIDSIHNQLVDIVIPDSVMTIGAAAFYNNALVSVIIGNGVISIEDSAFARNNIANLDLGKSVKILDRQAFYHNQIEDLEIPNSVTTLGSATFHTNKLKSVYIPQSVTDFSHILFSSNPLEVVFTDQGNVEVLMNKLTSSVFREINTNYTLLGEGKPIYANHVVFENTVSLGEKLKFEVISSMKYIHDNNNLGWNEHDPVVQWYKDDEVLIDQTDLVLIIEDIQREDLGNYYVIVDGEELPTILVDVFYEDSLEPEEQTPSEEVKPPEEQTPPEEVKPPEEQTPPEEVKQPEEQTPPEEVKPPIEQTLPKEVTAVEDKTKGLVNTGDVTSSTLFVSMSIISLIGAYYIVRKKEV